ncbi:MAG: isoprenylcysteine carboxylmethyltransferase family protein [Bacteroidales bacterium]|nr:isoprenylcysteine carboxylmethyltransferase family protein [Bacteroidales bacterium]
MAITFTGFTIMGKSRDLFKKQQTTLDIKESTALITEGVFSRTRNPMYIGMFLLLLGIAVCFMNLFSILAAFCFLGIIRIVFIPKEERLLTSVFKQDYLDYKNKVRRWI